ncbi:hypothetical protein CRENBAI_021546 [Crenichthys baileyi]|uniref:Uncharacterized protein n=1 Tax=Crenichthys baileyi TaxID=28760 RepID=A0AAV9R1I8_9TELE
MLDVWEPAGENKEYRVGACESHFSIARTQIAKGACYQQVRQNWTFPPSASLLSLPHPCSSCGRSPYTPSPLPSVSFFREYPRKASHPLSQWSIWNFGVSRGKLEDGLTGTAQRQNWSSTRDHAGGEGGDGTRARR